MRSFSTGGGGGGGGGSASLGSVVEINKALGAAGSVGDVMSLAQRECERMNLVNCVTALQRIAKLQPPSSPLKGRRDKAALEQLTRRASECLASERPQTRHVAGLLWACGKLSIKPVCLIQALLRGGLSLQAHWWKPQEVSMAIWGLGKLGMSPSETAETSAERLISVLLSHHLSASNSKAFDPQGLANIVGGVAAVAGLDASGHVKRLMGALRGKLGGFRPQELANTLSGLAKLGAKLQESEGLAEELGKATRERLGECTPQNLANAAWAATKLAEGSMLGQEGRDALSFWGLFAPSVLERVAELNAQELSMCTWAAAQSLSSCTVDAAEQAELTGALAGAAEGLAGGMEAQQVATITLALAKLGHPGKGTFMVLSKAARGRMADFNAQDLDNLASGYARLARWKGPKLVASLAGAALEALSRPAPAGAGAVAGSFPIRNMANLVCAMAKLSSACKGPVKGARELAGAVAGLLGEEVLGGFNLRDLANTAWGLAFLDDQERPKCMKAIARRAAAVLGVGTFNAQECSKLLYAMGKVGVRCKELEEAAGSQRELAYTFEGVGSVVLQQAIGGTKREFWVREDTGAIAGNGGALFEDSYVLAEWLTRHAPGAAAAAGMPQAPAAHKSWQGVTMVELGAGIGLCSIVAQRLGMDVTTTDGDESVLEMLMANAARNEEGGGTRGKLRSRLLKWGADSPLASIGLKKAPDVVIATGCVYGSDEGVWEALVGTLNDLCGPQTVVIFCHGTGAAPGVHQLRGKFYAKAAPLFEICRASQHTLHAEHQGCQIHFMVRRGVSRPQSEQNEEDQAIDSGRKRKKNEGKEKKLKKQRK